MGGGGFCFERSSLGATGLNTGVGETLAEPVGSFEAAAFAGLIIIGPERLLLEEEDDVTDAVDTGLLSFWVSCVAKSNGWR